MKEEKNNNEFEKSIVKSVNNQIFYDFERGEFSDFIDDENFYNYLKYNILIDFKEMYDYIIMYSKNFNLNNLMIDEINIIDTIDLDVSNYLSRVFNHYEKTINLTK
jgi:hypothetical protein